MPDRIFLLPMNTDKHHFILQILVTVLLITSIWLAFRLFRVQWKIKGLIDKLNTMEVDVVKTDYMDRGEAVDDRSENKEEVKVEENVEASEQVKLEIPGEKEPAYVLSSQQAGSLMKKIRIYMESDKPYLDPKFNMNKMCDALNINRTYLSCAINQKTGQRFETFINTYRISDAVKLLAIEESSQYTLEYLATKVGFQSKSTFNRSFKQLAGINPSFFQRIILQDKAARKFFFEYFEDLKKNHFTSKNK